ncbi:hypothetical protein Tco_1062062, partial [Tanacetum coccineum]
MVVLKVDQSFIYGKTDDMDMMYSSKLGNDDQVMRLLEADVRLLAAVVRPFKIGVGHLGL